VDELTLGEVLKRFRSESHLRNDQLAGRLGVSGAMLNRLLADELPRLDAVLAVRISDCLGGAFHDIRAVVATHAHGWERRKLALQKRSTATGTY
jgi:transcriptional regulator with XRE-family HTH domain